MNKLRSENKLTTNNLKNCNDALKHLQLFDNSNKEVY